MWVSLQNYSETLTLLQNQNPDSQQKCLYKNQWTDIKMHPTTKSGTTDSSSAIFFQHWKTVLYKKHIYKASNGRNFVEEIPAVII